MDDYISREAAIAYIREQAEESQKAFDELGGESGIYADAYNDLAEDFYRIPAADVEPVRRWIPCSERMPETDGPYLVVNNEIGWIGVYNFDREKDFPGMTGKKNVWWRMGDDRYPKMFCGATHWMPLPELPEEGGKEK